MSCHREKEEPSSLPPPCYHRKLILFYYPTDGCLPPKPKSSKSPRCYCRPLSPPLTCKPRPEDSLPPPTICIAGRCPQPSHSESYYCPSIPKILPPPSSVRFCIRYTNEGSCYYPSYWSQLPKCPTNIS